jgi:hypothetical protein
MKINEIFCRSYVLALPPRTAVIAKTSSDSQARLGLLQQVDDLLIGELTLPGVRHSLG